MASTVGSRVAGGAGSTARMAARIVKPVASSNAEEARHSVLKVYKDLQKMTPVVWWNYDMIDIPLPVFRQLLKNQFLKHAHLQDIRIIDRKVQEVREHIKSLKFNFYTSFMLRNFLFGSSDWNCDRPMLDAKPKDFLSKFLHGKD